MSKFYVKPNIDFYAFNDSWLSDRMLFVAGPRQVGKTTYAKKKIAELGGNYFTWDDRKVRTAYAKDSDFFAKTTKASELVVFDEIHKIKNWKNILKGAFDVYKDQFRFLITGSAKLDTFRRSGDSLVGRYFLTHMMPLSLGDLSNNNFQGFHSADDLLITAHNQSTSQINFRDEIESLVYLSGFPEPFFKSQETFTRRWQRQHRELLVREDLRDLTNVKNLDAVENLVNLLEPRVGSTCSIDSLAKLLEVDYKSVKQWLLYLEKIMLIYGIKPWSKKINRSLHKNSKFYFYDWSCIKDVGARLENFVASQLLKICILYQDRFGYKYDLHYIRTYDGMEVDFLISCDSQPWLLVEVKNDKPDISPALYKFKEELNVTALVLTNQPKFNERRKDGISIMSLERFFSLTP
jgi:predicted AAA+ superfamily ATPase